MRSSNLRVLVRGAGETATGVAIRLFRCGMPVLLTELPQPLAVRRTVSFSEAIYTEQAWVEGLEARRAEGFRHALAVQESGAIPVVVDPEAKLLALYRPAVVVVAIRSNGPAPTRVSDALLVVGLGSGFEVGVHGHYVVETFPGHSLGRLYDRGRLEDTARVVGDRAIRAPIEGPFRPKVSIGDRIESGALVAEVNGQLLHSGTGGLVRGILRPGVRVGAGTRVADVDPGVDPRSLHTVSERALAAGGAVLEAILRHFGPPPVGG